MLFLARWMQGRFSLFKPAWVGALLVMAGGLSKASWKLIVVTTEANPQIMSKALFPLLGAGFVFLTVSLILGLLKRERWVWPVALSLAAAFYYWSYSKVGEPNPRAWMFVLLGMTSGFSTLLSLSLSGVSAVRMKFVSALLMLASIAGSFYLAKLARLPDQTLALQWKEEMINTGSQLSFLIGVLLLIQTVFNKVRNP